LGSKHASKTKYIRRRIGKVNTPLNEKLIHVEWGECKLGDLFEIKGNSQLNKDSFVFREKGEYPYFTRTEFNNGILGYVDYLDDEHKMAGGCLAVGMIAMKFFYMQKDFYAGQFTKRAIPKSFSLSQRVASYFISLLNKNQKIFQNVLVGSFESVFNNTKIKLPIKNNEIDFEFMESFVAELEAERIKKLDDYLVANGFKNYILTDEEKQALEGFKNIKWGEFKIGDLFERINTKKLPFKAKDLPNEVKENFTLPALTSSFNNQGLNYYVPREASTILKDVISIPSNSDVYRAYFQSNEFTVLSDAYAIRWILDGVNLLPKQYLFAVQCINKVTDLSIYSYKNKLGGWNVVKNKFIQLPEKDNQPNYELMETLISAIQKLVIKDVVLYVNNKKNG
jgi:hypothetical protein